MKLNKVIAPVVITIIIIIYYSLLIFGIISIPDLLWLKLFGVLIPLFFIGVSIFVLIERIKEIKGGEEDDLSKY